MSSKTALKVLSGSHLRNLNTPDSDLDYKRFIIPSFNSLFNGKMVKNLTTSSEVDIETHDIRRLVGLLEKANITYVELLFSPEIKTYGYSEMEGLISMRESIASMNLSSLFSSNIGIYNSQREQMTKETSEDTARLIAIHGYNPKKFYVAQHFLRVLRKYCEQDFTNFASVVWYTGKEREEMLEYKSGVYPLSEAYKLLDDSLALCRGNIATDYKQHSLDVDTREKMINLIKKLVRDSLR